MGSTAKTCSRCGEEKPIEEFHRDSYTVSGLKPYCKVCSRERNRSLRKRNAATVHLRIAPLVKRCGRCERTLDASCFTRSRTAADTLCPICKECNAQYRRDRRHDEDG